MAYIITPEQAEAQDSAFDPITCVDERDDDAPVYHFRSGRFLRCNVALCEGCDEPLTDGVCRDCAEPPACPTCDGALDEQGGCDWCEPVHLQVAA